MELDELKRYLQQQFADGLVTIIGSGLSAASGLPTMQALADHLLRTIPERCDGASSAEWEAAAVRLSAGDVLERALHDIDTESALVPLLVAATAELILDAEGHVIRRVACGDLQLPFARLVRVLTRVQRTAHVVTSNYDRLIEFATEMEGVGLDTGFAGYNYGGLDPTTTMDSLSSFAPAAHGQPFVQRKLRPHVALHKPHGSIDWFLHGDTPIRCTLPLDAPRLMITPGVSKYRRGYDSPFDYQRAAANRAIDEAARFLVIGYGFNDDQLETHLRPKLREERPCVLLTKDLTENARRIVVEYPGVLALVEHSSNGRPHGTQCIWGGEETVFENVRLWHLSAFVREVLE